MNTEQLPLFDDDAVTGTGRLHPWPTVAADIEPDLPAEDPDQLTFDEAGTEAAAA